MSVDIKCCMMGETCLTVHAFQIPKKQLDIRRLFNKFVALAYIFLHWHIGMKYILSERSIFLLQICKALTQYINLVWNNSHINKGNTKLPGQRAGIYATSLTSLGVDSVVMKAVFPTFLKISTSLSQKGTRKV